MSRINDGRPPYEKLVRRRGPGDDDFYRRWSEAHGHCHFCGVPVGRCSGLSTHHIAHGAGRSHEACCLLRACDRCHRLAELERVVEGGVLLPTLTVAVCVTVKAVRDPASHDPARLAALLGRNLPDPEPVPAVIEAAYRRWRPADTTHFFYGLEADACTRPCRRPSP